MAEIRGNTGEIRGTGESIRQDAGQYRKVMTELFDAVNALSSSFTSDDGNNYVEVFNSHRMEFEDLQKKLENCLAVSFEEIADRYEKTIKNNMAKS